MSESSNTISAFQALGGEAGVRRLVDGFYDLMDADPAYAVLRALHPADLSGSRDKLYWFLCGWLGGPQLYVERFGHPRLRARHLPFSIGVVERDQWMDCMLRSLSRNQVPDGIARQLAGSLFTTADWMRNRAEESGDSDF
ncbi:cyanoglobin [Sinimarinibacterium sp. CAU 1509]|uniref:group II truncated hemoglobin n=1 Tax=Sinimarinibacterium sp. CAU 1509 TaxID=2562283 RepID=UPI0010AD052A|nr:group II truncated hemoglobin [Sinimarinibacterium sp. CAU 1509]TJY61897.1 cyanoglobin [Sinimarinibacterium sp. CAU 1509]